jgi:eukaryotic-like serine/threonine-protein kinase
MPGVPAAIADRYRIERQLGQGGMATVYLAHDVKHDRRVALKVLKPELAAVVGAERFLAEIRTTANLQHPHVLALFDSGQIAGTVFYVMPFVDGESLRDRLAREKHLPIDDAVRIAREVGDALHYAHQHGVIHRDIKPENILLQGGHALVADFGIALAAANTGGTRMTETGMSLGTPRYMSPEQAMGERSLDARTDIYALGCVLYEMLTGDAPFLGSTAQAIIAKVLTDKPAPIIAQRARVPEHVEDAVLTALEKLPADRFATAALFTDALTGAGSQTAPRLRARTAARARSWIRDWRSWAALGVAATAIVVAGTRFGAGNGLEGVAFVQKSFTSQAIFNARFAPDGRTIIYSAALEGNAPRLYIVRPDVVAPTPFGPERTHLLGVSSKGDVAVLLGARFLAHRLFTGTLAQLPIGSGAAREIQSDVREADWAPDGASLAIIHVVGGKDRLEYPAGKTLYESAGYMSDLRVSPDGERVALFEHPARWDDRGAVIVVERAGRRVMLTDGYDALEGLAWTPDSRAVVFSASVEGEYREVRTVDLRGRVRTKLPAPGILTIQDVTRDGRWLVTSEVEQNRMYVRGPGAGADRDLTWLDRSQSPMLSADGRSMVFTSAAIDAGFNYSTMLRGTDGSPVVRLGEGGVLDFTTDGRWALSIIFEPLQLMLYPTGAGQPRRVDRGQFQNVSAARFFADDRRLLVCGNEPSRPPRCFAGTGDTTMVPVTGDGTHDGVASPDGREVIARITDGTYQLFPIGGGPPKAVQFLTPDDNVVDWDRAGSMIVHRGLDVPLRLERVDMSTGRRSLLATVAPANRAGILAIRRLSIARDVNVYAYWTAVYMSSLFTVEGMR